VVCVSDDPADWFSDWELNSAGIEVRLIEDAMASVTHEVWFADLPGELEATDRLDFDTAGQLVESIRSQDEQRFAPPFMLDFRWGYTSWGADGAAQTLVLQVAAAALGIGAHAVVGNAVYDTLKATVLRLARRWQDRADWEPEPLTSEEAASRARWHVIRHFDLETDPETFDRPSLAVVGQEERVDGSRVVRLKDGDRRYEVELLDEAGLVVIGRIGWQEEPST
jgi:hypothetical protein